MFFVGYISSFIIAIGLLIFYIGNVTQYVIASIKDKQDKEICIAKNDKKPIQKCYVVSVDKASNDMAITPKQDKPINVIHLNKERYHLFSKKITKKFHKTYLFLRPPPALVS